MFSLADLAREAKKAANLEREKNKELSPDAAFFKEWSARAGSFADRSKIKSLALQSPIFDLLLRPNFSVPFGDERRSALEALYWVEKAKDPQAFTRSWALKNGKEVGRVRVEHARQALLSFAPSVDRVTRDRNELLSGSIAEWEEAKVSQDPGERSRAGSALDQAVGASAFFGLGMQAGRSMDSDLQSVGDRRHRIALILNLKDSQCTHPGAIASRKDLLPTLGIKVPFAFTDPSGQRWRIRDEIDVIDLISRQQFFSQTWEKWKSCQLTDQEMIGQFMSLNRIVGSFMDTFAQRKNIPISNLPSRGDASASLASLNAYSRDSFSSVLRPSHPLHKTLSFPKSFACASPLDEKKQSQVLSVLFHPEGVPTIDDLKRTRPRPAGSGSEEEAACRYLFLRDAWSTSLATLFLEQEKERNIAYEFAKKSAEWRIEAWKTNGSCALKSDEQIYPDLPTSFSCR
jgi:hypothetical protein